MIRTLNHFIQDRIPNRRPPPHPRVCPDRSGPSAAKESVKVASSAAYRKASRTLAVHRCRSFFCTRTMALRIRYWCQTTWMNRLRKVGAILVAVCLFGIVIHELIHFLRYGHLAPPGLHADTILTTQSDLLGIEGVAKIYDARLTNYGILPTTMTVCDYLDYSSSHKTMVAYIVERWDLQLRRWSTVPEWDEYGSRLFCRPSFEVTETHLVRRIVWPGQSIWVGQVVPPERGGFHLGDDGRFTIFLRPDGNRDSTLSTAPFRVEQQLKTKVPLPIGRH